MHYWQHQIILPNKPYHFHDDYHIHNVVIVNFNRLLYFEAKLIIIVNPLEFYFVHPISVQEYSFISDHEDVLILLQLINQINLYYHVI